MTDIIKELFALQDEKYRDFHSRLMPTVEKERIIGVRTPQLRSLARKMFKEGEYRDFLSSLPHFYYEENNLHAFLIEQIKDIDGCLAEVDAFLPYVDNWATCDMLRPKAFARHKERLLVKIEEWLSSPHLYTVRFAIGMLMVHFLKEDFKEGFAESVAKTDTREYYLSMMVAWYFATALSSQYDIAVKYLEQNRLDIPTHNRTIQKAVDSFRIEEEKKEYLKTLRRK